MGGAIVKKIYWVLTLFLMVFVTAFLLVGCETPGAEDAAWVGEYLAPTAMGGDLIYNLRSDDNYSIIHYAGTAHATAMVIAQIGHYDVTGGQITFTRHYSFSGGVWTKGVSTDGPYSFSYTAGVTMTINGATYSYYGLQTALPVPVL
jgi:hypothetical protein